jgi:hypothetical protein
MKSSRQRTTLIRAIGRATLLACCGAVTAVAPAAADTTPAGDFSFKFSTKEPGTPTALEFRQLYKNPDDAEAKPSPVQRFLFAAPDGSVFDGTAVPACSATDQQFQQMGKAACPAESIVGEGFITVMTGFPGEQPFPADATVFNSGDGIIELFTEQNTGTFTAIERPKFKGTNAFEDTDIAPTAGGPPDGRSAAREAYLEFPLTRGADGRSFITTPGTCPAARIWTARFEWTNADGNSYANSAGVPCAASAPNPALPTLGKVHLRLRRCVPRAGRCPGGRRIVVFGQAPAGARVTVRIRRGARTVAVRSPRATRGRYRVRFDPRRGGRYMAHVVTTARGQTLRASSRRVTVRIR